MTSRSSYRALSWLCLVGVLAFYAWITVAPFGYAATPVIAAVILGLLLATLKLGARPPVDYWETDAEPAQVPRITVMILLGLTIQLAVSVVLRMTGQMRWEWAEAVYLLVWTVVPLAFIGLGIIRWPRRRASPRVREFLIVAAAAILVAAAMSYIGTFQYDGPRITPSPAHLAIGSSATLLGATMEEVIFRVLLLTALVKVSGSRMHALVLSSVGFALIHIPTALYGPVVEQDWTMLADYARSFWPELTMTIGFGFLFGALWLRTGSITLIAIVHTMCNIGPVLAGGLKGL